MRASTIGILLFVFGGFSLMNGIEWLAIVFFAMGLAMFFLYKEAAEVPVEYRDFGSQAPHAATASPHQQQPITIVEQAGHPDWSTLIQEHIILEKALGSEEREEKIEHMAKQAKTEAKKLEKEIKQLKRELVKQKVFKKKKKHETEW